MELPTDPLQPPAQPGMVLHDYGMTDILVDNANVVRTTYSPSQHKLTFTGLDFSATITRNPEDLNPHSSTGSSSDPLGLRSDHRRNGGLYLGDNFGLHSNSAVYPKPEQQRFILEFSCEHSENRTGVIER
jgi:hypothetical protein